MSLDPHSSPLWSRTTKLIVALAGLGLILLAAWRFQILLGQVVTAGILAYLLSPLIEFIHSRSPLSRGVAILLVYLTLLLLLIAGVTAVGVVAYNQALDLIEMAPDFINELVILFQSLSEDTERVITIAGYEFPIGRIDWNAVRDQALNLIEPALAQSGGFARQIASSTIRFLGTFFFVFIISAYMANEVPNLGSYINRLTYPAGYHDDAERLLKEFQRIWNAYLRGQVILGLTIGTAVSIVLGLLGVQNALGLGVLAGLLEFIPSIGPLISAAAAMLVAYFQPSNYLGLTSTQLVLIVLVVMIIIQQIENNVLVPRIVGDALDLHPILVIVGVLVGASVAGILGAILAAPVLATIKLVGIYAWRKLFDVNPFPPEDNRPPPQSIRHRLAKWFADRRKSAVNSDAAENSTADPEAH